MKKRVIRFIHRLPIVRGIIALIVELQEQVNILQEKNRQLERQAGDLKKRLEKADYELRKEIQYCYQKGLLPQQYGKALKDWFYEKTGSVLNLDNPKTFNEKIQWLKLYNSTPEKTRLADKYLARDYIKEKAGGGYLIPLLGVWDSFDEIDFAQLPERFVLKANHGSKWNVIVKDKSQLDMDDARRKFRKWLATDFAYTNGLELHYSPIRRKIIAEEYIEDIGEDIEYDFFCFHGKAYYIRYVTSWENGRKHTFYDTDWNFVPFTYLSRPWLKTPVERPDKLDDMIRLAECLSEGFKFVRVDMYLLKDGRVKVGELTFTHTSGVCEWYPPEWNQILGDLLDLDISSVCNR